jgi:hypothetical protein
MFKLQQTGRRGPWHANRGQSARYGTTRQASLLLLLSCAGQLYVC